MPGLSPLFLPPDVQVLSVAAVSEKPKAGYLTQLKSSSPRASTMSSSNQVGYMNMEKVPVGAMPETFGGEYNCLFGDGLWEDPHCCIAYTQVESLDKEAQEEDMHLFAPTVALVQ